MEASHPDTAKEESREKGKCPDRVVKVPLRCSLLLRLRRDLREVAYPVIAKQFYANIWRN